ncbi:MULTISPECIES: 3-deoxy-7-phosphoheptulonate synthase [Sporomusa]|uniref:Phospho-2-dehydro-3-deoxyheptonate aldolase n=2 Tax=Sporomusa TaxID=2375 RepID=A0ABP2C5V5_9FIRM|nr:MULTISPECIES: 3-deoxy-7-phosphoheptulonate synthase [Sporomusa]MCM0759246.1 3-deoxy-7-phosphoheptulonate synthase [Sporomusa sphaeroides DSM 2875]OLS58721.1 phospho-2-dehydro-3-deoxyheptonate aldolase [Sporomusa sphaeroides DSM 2875]CVK19769.1 Phospho-2-dehydro-3-deoxyheptonate aldolase [Sporomusa sphaeroides DSM 2875]SCM79780.1 Phospho-2-dehydro-3-deoxyheptonate aldolase [uncultured Sporomusa sp.]HML35383.1 3-deoxy-7-phosphoheptulonate synthase [Sporomusa sphaeroides]
MIIVMNPTATQTEIDNVIARVTAAGLKVHLSEGKLRTIIGLIGEKKLMVQLPLEAMAGVEKAISVTAGYKLVSREFKNEDTVIDVGGVLVGGPHIVVMAGPCAVESREQLLESARIVKEAGAQFLRGGAYKPRTSPYSFQGLEEKGLEMLAEARSLHGLKIVTEVVDIESVPVVGAYADVLQIGARNMQNFQLLKAVGKSGMPVLLKRGIAATINEWLHAAEYIMSEGNFNVMFCERGIRTFEEYTRNTLDLSAVAALKNLSHLPVIVDPSHGTGLWKLVRPMAKAAVAGGADGLMIEVHPNPAEALSDGNQSLTPANYQALMSEVAAVARAVDRRMA